MKSLKTLASALVVAALAGTTGLVHAQGSGTGAAGGASPGGSTNNNSGASMQNQPATGMPSATGTPTDSSTTGGMRSGSSATGATGATGGTGMGTGSMTNGTPRGLIERPAQADRN